jgi:periplasmic protein TonB
MFDDLVESSVVRKKTNKGWAIIVSTIVQVTVLIVLVLIPLIYTQALPKAMLSTLLVAPPPPPPPPPPPQEIKTQVVVKQPPRLITQGKLVAPRAIPREVVVFREEALPPEPPASNEGILGGLGGDILGGLGADASGLAPPPPKTPQRIKLGGNVQEAKIVARPNPAYPPLARQARIQGNVVLHAIIDKDGTVTQLEVVSGHPLLVQSALAAVRQWRYQPTLLNNEPVEVDTTITVNFVLGG